MTNFVDALNAQVVIELIKLISVIVAAVASILTYHKTSEVKQEFNHKMDAFIDLTAKSSHAEGMIAGIETEKKNPTK